MDKWPKLKVRKEPSDPPVIMEFAEAKDFPFKQGMIITVEGRMISSYDNLINLVEKNHYQNREFLNVVFLTLVLGG